MINLTDSAENERSAMETCTYFEEVFVKFLFISCSSCTRTTASLFYPLNWGMWRRNDSQQILSKCSKWSFNIPNLARSFQMKFQETSRESFIETSRKSFTWNFTTVVAGASNLYPETMHFNRPQLLQKLKFSLKYWCAEWSCHKVFEGGSTHS